MADNKTIKNLFCAFILLLSYSAHAENYFSCGLGIREHDWPESGWTIDSGDRYRFVECQWQAAANIRQQGWFLSMPSIFWHQEYTTDMSRNRHQLMAREANIHWPIYRFNDFLFGFNAGKSRFRQQHETSQDIFINQDTTFLPKGQQVLLNRETWHIGALMDIQHTGSPLSTISLSYHSVNQVLAIEHPIKGLGVHDADVRLWQIKMAKEPLSFGLMWHWSLALQAGDIHSIKGMNPNQLATKDVLGINGHLGFMWRYRWSRTAHPYINLSVQTDQWHLVSANSSTAKADSIYTLSYEISTGLSWRFR